MSDLQKLVAVLFLRAAPQDMPYSLQTLVTYALFYVLSGVVVLQSTLKPEDLMAGLLLSFFIQLGFTYFVLRALNHSARFVQTISVILGVGILFNLLSWPVFAMLADETISDTLKSTLSLVFLLLISWEVLVKAHIFKHALEMKMFGALALSFSLFFISIALSQLMFPAETAG